VRHPRAGQPPDNIAADSRIDSGTTRRGTGIACLAKQHVAARTSGVLLAGTSRFILDVNAGIILVTFYNTSRLPRDK